MKREQRLAGLIVGIGVIVSIGLWQTLPRPGETGRIILGLIIGLAAIAVVNNSKGRASPTRAGQLIAVLLVSQLAAQLIVYTGLSSLD